MPHGSAKTTPEIRSEIQRSDASQVELAARYSINRKTVAKWKKRTFVHDDARGPRHHYSTVLSPEDEALLVMFRRMTLLPLDDCLYALKTILPDLSRSALHRCYRRHGVSRLPQELDEIGGKSSRRDALGHFRIAVAEFYTQEGGVYQFLAIDRVSRYAVARLAKEATASAAAAFLGEVIEALPYQIHSVLTDSEAPFTPCHAAESDGVIKMSGDPFGDACRVHGIQHRLIGTDHLWPCAPFSRMENALRQAPIKRYKTNNMFSDGLRAFVDICNFSTRFKNLRGLTPHQFISALYNN